MHPGPHLIHERDPVVVLEVLHPPPDEVVALVGPQISVPLKVVRIEELEQVVPLILVVEPYCVGGRPVIQNVAWDVLSNYLVLLPPTLASAK